jgi:hypothetical protein
MKLSIDVWGTSPFNFGIEATCLRQEEGEANAAEQQASQTAGTLGTEAGSELGTLSPFFSREMQAKHAYDPTQINELLTSAGAGTGAATGDMATNLKRQAAVTGNAAGTTKALEEAYRDRMKANAGVSEGVAAQDVQGAKQLNQAGASGMSGLYGENLKGQLAAMGQESSDINAATDASKTGWLQNAEGMVNTAANAATGYANAKNA